MGFYIQTPTVRDKAAHIAAEYHGMVLGAPPVTYADIPPGKALIVVVDNGPSEAAAFCFDEYEFRAFTDPADPRPKSYVLMDHALAATLSGYKAWSA
jgi:hypothetical protein